MLLAHPAVLRDLVERHTALQRSATARPADPAIRRQLADVTYTLCVTTGTRDIADALRAARRRLADAPDAATGSDARSGARSGVRAGGVSGAVDTVLPRPAVPAARTALRAADRAVRPEGRPAGHSARTTRA
ncbi:DUF5133 domain-containing protein [Streptomyces mobaraensis NBRC 13819 = DSM 40847]|uniref:DUF5133 domain-containing protein n=1 Tax=Streptomyces mobaraensis (strain ATCC 29032 / DSM 40847 / JCM 4168 / NBRC 13819 / NCIMB 11159 / IPCR 16-22) TaxID=1223523 RepID=M3C7R9_STRM1|nr:DUF5133 domain-containing protein [Streptomyces mobaraensis]EME99971.1 hypothetical protein H340_13861 [Streptomyces mobaraensis NBRC 13819 = DSM 40847]QTT72193.1 DUF5133 domain-containing protein [Streptomyces mobaraensis NBRC 13819 = DSM 40847]